MEHRVTTVGQIWCNTSRILKSCRKETGLPAELGFILGELVENGDTSMNNLKRKYSIIGSRMSFLSNYMLENGYAKLEISATDKRGRNLRITAKGKEAYKKFLSFFQKNVAQINNASLQGVLSPPSALTMS